KPDYFHHIQHRKFQTSSKITLSLSLLITIIFTVLDFLAAILSNSLTLLSHSFHILTHVLALPLSILAIYFSTNPPTNNYTYPFLPFQIILAFLNPLTLILISLPIIYDAIIRIIHPTPVETPIIILIPFIPLIPN
ncbi:cation transporter, partial [Staphylococcus epidermidis]|uniref:cation transporter n=1 Tax=Staphylococcus epidermidis TaxID=1282 RepID=UPI0011A476F4